MTQVNPPSRQPATEWRLPEPVPMGLPLVPEDQWTALSHDDGVGE